MILEICWSCYGRLLYFQSCLNLQSLNELYKIHQSSEMNCKSFCTGHLCFPRESQNFHEILNETGLSPPNNLVFLFMNARRWNTLALPLNSGDFPEPMLSLLSSFYFWENVLSLHCPNSLPSFSLFSFPFYSSKHLLCFSINYS